MNTSSSHPTDAAQAKRFLQPCLLLLIAESPTHGYELIERLADFGFERDPGGLYRALRVLERDGLVHSRWILAGSGPGRRRYELAAEGWERLRAAAETVLELRGVLDSFLARLAVVEQEAAERADDEAIDQGLGGPEPARPQLKGAHAFAGDRVGAHAAAPQRDEMPG